MNVEKPVTQVIAFLSTDGEVYGTYSEAAVASLAEVLRTECGDHNFPSYDLADFLREYKAAIAPFFKALK